MTIRNEILDEAKGTVADRGIEYGDLVQNFENIAGLWSVILRTKVEPYQVSLALDAIKTARIMSNPRHRDSWVDKAGYSACGAEVVFLPIEAERVFKAFQAAKDGTDGT